MDETCELMERIDYLTDELNKNNITTNDFLAEIPSFINAFSNVKSFGLWSLDACGELGQALDAFSTMGAEAVYYYPKAMCEDVSRATTCLGQLGRVISVTLDAPIKWVLGDGDISSFALARSMLMEVAPKVPGLCASLSALGLFNDADVRTLFLENWSSLRKRQRTRNGGKTSENDNHSRHLSGSSNVKLCTQSAAQHRSLLHPAAWSNGTEHIRKGV